MRRLKTERSEMSTYSVKERGREEEGRQRDREIEGGWGEVYILTKTKILIGADYVSNKVS